MGNEISSGSQVIDCVPAGVTVMQINGHTSLLGAEKLPASWVRGVKGCHNVGAASGSLTLEADLAFSSREFTLDESNVLQPADEKAVLGYDRRAPSPEIICFRPFHENGNPCCPTGTMLQLTKQKCMVWARSLQLHHAFRCNNLTLSGGAKLIVKARGVLADSVRVENRAMLNTENADQPGLATIIAHDKATVLAGRVRGAKIAGSKKSRIVVAVATADETEIRCTDNSGVTVGRGKNITQAKCTGASRIIISACRSCADPEKDEGSIVEFALL